MSLSNSSRRGKKTPPPGETGQEAAYLRFLSEKQVPVTVKLRDGECVHGWIEYFDEQMIRLTREGRPNLFIYKQQIRTISEGGRRGGEEGRKRPARTAAGESARHENGSAPPQIGVAPEENGRTDAAAEGTKAEQREGGDPNQKHGEAP